jgi:hypothetical protein
VKFSPLFKIFTIAFLTCLSVTYSQTDTTDKFITIIPGEEYEAGWLHEIFFGAHWRDIWTTPIKVEILDLNNFDGGITPIKRGGGQQTKSLRFRSKNGLIWKFRSVDKDPSKILPPDLQETIADEIVQDQISTANPMAPFVVSTFLDAVDLVEAKPKLVYMPDNEKLGEYREEFGGMLGFIEIHPGEGGNGKAGFNGAIDVKGTYKLLNYLEKKRSQKINSKVFLKARLIDLLLGDWDRHMDQWRWAKYSENEREAWYPIPRDRDQVFAKYDGIFPFIAAYLVPAFNNFGYDYPQMEDLTWNGRHLDRRVLTELDKPTWDSIATFVQSKITDDLIDAALSELPPESYSMSVNELRDKLISRRDKFQNASNEFYELVNIYADVFCSIKDDYVEVNRLNDRSTEVIVYRKNKNTGGKKGEPLFHKVFDNEITIDIRIHLNNGDDIAVVKGECDHSPLVRIIGGKGKDVLKDESVVNGYFLSITPFRSAENKTIFYDSGKKSAVHPGAGTVYDDMPEPEPKDDTEKYEPVFLDRGHNWLIMPAFGFDSDNGVTFGAGVQLSKYNFRARPLESLQSMTGSYSTIGGGTLKYNGDFYSIVRNGKLNINVTYTTLFAIRYFGFGNETTFSGELNDNDFYRVNQKLFTIFPMFYYNVSENYTARIGISVIYTNTKMDNAELLDNFKYESYGLGRLNPLGLHAGLEIEERDNTIMPSRGFYGDLYGSVFPKVFNIDEVFYKAGADIRGYLPIGLFEGATLALRAGGEKVWNKYPFYAASFLGGFENLRGYNRWRFSGDASVFGQAELRIWLSKFKLILKNKFGINIFTETGRVFVQGDSEDSKQWHPSYGVGFWLSYLHDTIIVSTYIANSPDRMTFSFGFSMAY